MESKLTPATIKAIAKHVGDGLPMKYAALSVGVGESTLKLWMKHAKRPDADGPHLALLDAIQKARVKAIATAMGQISKAARTQWKAAAWKLSILDPDTFGTEGRLIRELKALVEKLAKGDG